MLVLPSLVGLWDLSAALARLHGAQPGRSDLEPGEDGAWSPRPPQLGGFPAWTCPGPLCWDAAAKPELPRCLQHCSVPSPPELAQFPSGILTERTALCVCAAPSTTGASLGWAGGAAVLSLGTSSRAVPQQGDHSLTGVSCPGSCCAGGLLGCVVTQGVGCQRWEGHRLCSQSRCCAPRRDPREGHPTRNRGQSELCLQQNPTAPGSREGTRERAQPRL